MSTDEYLIVISDQLADLQTTCETITSNMETMYEQQTLLVYVITAVLMILAVHIGVSLFKVFQNGIK